MVQRSHRSTLTWLNARMVQRSYDNAYARLNDHMSTLVYDRMSTLGSTLDAHMTHSGTPSLQFFFHCMFRGLRWDIYARPNAQWSHDPTYTHPIYRFHVHGLIRFCTRISKLRSHLNSHRLQRFRRLHCSHRHHHHMDRQPNFLHSTTYPRMSPEHVVRGGVKVYFSFVLYIHIHFYIIGLIS